MPITNYYFVVKVPLCMHATQHPTIFIFAQFQYFFSIWITANPQEGNRSYEILPFVKDRDAKRSEEQSACAAYLRHWNKIK